MENEAKVPRVFLSLSLFGAQLLFMSWFIQFMNNNKLLSFCSSLQPQIMLVSLPIKTIKSHIFSLVISTKKHIKLAINPKAQLLSIFSSNLSSSSFFFIFLFFIISNKFTNKIDYFMLRMMSTL